MVDYLPFERRSNDMKALKLLFQYIMPKKWISIWAGACANIQNRYVKNFWIRHFIKAYSVDMSEALDSSITDYRTFNDFFIRKLKPTLRPVASTIIVSPVDGEISALGRIDKTHIFQAKGRYYTIEDLLRTDPSYIAPFYDGHFITLYLSPKDYHRIHMPMDGTLEHAVYIPGNLFSVQPFTTEHIQNLFANNERCVLYFQTPMGRMAIILVGAVIVGKINTYWHGEIARSKKPRVLTTAKERHRKKGEELGYFTLGSTVIMLLEKDIPWHVEKCKPESHLKYGEALN